MGAKHDKNTTPHSLEVGEGGQPAGWGEVGIDITSITERKRRAISILPARASKPLMNSSNGRSFPISFFTLTFSCGIVSVIIFC